MEYNKKIKVWVTALLIVLVVAGGTATLLTQKYQLFRGNFAIQLGGNGAVSPVPPGGNVIQGNLGDIINTDISILSSCGEYENQATCDQQLDCQWVDGGGNFPSACAPDPVVVVEADPDFTGEDIIVGTQAVLASFSFLNFSKDDIALKDLTLSMGGSYDGTFKDPTIFVDIPDITKDPSTFGAYSSGAVGALNGGNGIYSWKGMGNVTLRAEKATRITILGSAASLNKNGSNNGFYFSIGLRNDIVIDSNVPLTGTFPVASTDITIQNAILGNVLDAGNLGGVSDVGNFLIPDECADRLTEQICKASGTKCEWAHTASRFDGTAIFTCRNNLNPEEGGTGLGENAGQVDATLTITNSIDAPSGDIAYAGPNFMTVAKYQFTVDPANVTTTIDQVIFNEKLIAGGLKLEDIKGFQLITSQDGRLDPANVVPSSPVIDFANRRVKFSGINWIISGTDYLFLQIQINNKDVLGTGKKVAFGINQATDVLFKTDGKMAANHVYPVQSNEVKIVPPGPFVDVSLGANTPPAATVPSNSTQFAVTSLKLTSTAATEIDKIEVAVKTFGNDTIPPTDIEAVQLFDGSNAISAPTTIEPIGLQAEIPLTQKIIFAQAGEKNIMVKAKLKPTAADGKKFALGINATDDIHFSANPATVVLANQAPVFGNTMTVSNVVIAEPEKKEPLQPALNTPTLSISTATPAGQAPDLGPTSQFVKAIQVNITTKAAQLRTLSLTHRGTLDPTKITTVKLFAPDGREYTVGNNANDLLSSITKNPQSGDIEINFRTSGDAQEVNALPQQTTQYVVYVLASIGNADNGKTIQYAVTSGVTNPNDASQNFNLAGPVFTVRGDAQAGANQNTGSNTGSNGGNVSSGKLTCEAQGKFTYTGPERPGVRTPGMCIDCSTEVFIQNGGRCSRSVALSDPNQFTNTGNQTGTQTQGTTQTQGSQTTNTAGANVTGAGSVGTSGTGGSRGSAPDLNGSSRIVSAPDRGNTGPGIAVYLAGVGAANVGIWLRRRKKASASK